MTIKILHFAPDEKFIPLQQDLFEEAYPGANTWIVHGKPDRPFQFDVLNSDTRKVLSSYFWSRTLKKESNNFDLLVVHSMTRSHADGVKTVRPGICILWLGWGSDYYHLLKSQLGGLHLKKTEALYQKLSDNRRESRFHELTLSKILGYARKLFFMNFNHTGLLKKNSIQTVAKRIDIFSVFETEMEMLEKVLPKLKSDYVYYKHYYYTIEDVYDKGPAEMAGPHILLGNSATFTNNHIEAIDILEKIMVSEKRKIIVPLNYGDPSYAEEICQIGKNQLGDSFVPLKDWLTLEEFNQKISQCGFVIMNHKRQQAFGNINTALYKGAKVFLRPESLLFKYYKSISMEIFSVEDLEKFGENALQPLDIKTKKKNRAIISELMGRKKVVDHIRGLERFVIKKRMVSQKGG